MYFCSAAFTILNLYFLDRNRDSLSHPVSDSEYQHMPVPRRYRLNSHRDHVTFTHDHIAALNRTALLDPEHLSYTIRR